MVFYQKLSLEYCCQSKVRLPPSPRFPHFIIPRCRVKNFCPRTLLSDPNQGSTQISRQCHRQSLTENFFPEETALKETSDLSFLRCGSQVTSVALELGSRESRCAVLVQSGWGGETGNQSLPFVSYGLKSASKEDQFDWDELKVISKN